MPEIQYPKNPNSDTAFVVQEDGTKNRALMTAPQDTSTLELPKNANSCKGYVTVDGKKQRVILTADIGGGGGSSLPDQTGHSGEFLTTDGTDASWAAVDALPDQTGQSGKFLTTDGTDASWASPLASTTVTIAVADWNGGTTVSKTVSGLTATSVVFASPDGSSMSEWASAGVYASGQNTDTLTFTASSTPTASITVVVAYC